MNILFVSPTPFHPFRGVGRVTDTLTREFPKRGYQVFYWYMEENGYGYGYGADHGRRKKRNVIYKWAHKIIRMFRG